MPADVNGRIRYLALAAFAQKVVDSLVGYLNRGEQGALSSALADAGRVVGSFRDGGFVDLKGVAAIGGFEQLLTVRDAWSGEDAARTENLIGTVKSSLECGAMPGEPAQELIRSFLKLERQALWNANQPPPLETLTWTALTS